MGWLVYEFQWTVCVFGCSVANQYTGGYGCFNCLGGIHVYIFGSKVFSSCTRGILTNSFLAF